jgi:cell division septation protein DedD
MTKDYAKYGIYRKTPLRRYRVWKMLGLVIGLLILATFFLMPHHKSLVKPEITSASANKLKKKIVESPSPKPPEPEFDFYNILPQENFSLSSPAAENTASSVEKNISPANKTSVAAPLEKPLNNLMNTTPEQVAIAEAKKQLEQEISQPGKAVYILVLGSFSNAAQAEQYQAQALLKGFPVQNAKHNVNGKLSYQLFMGPYLSLTLASQQQKHLNAAGIQATLVKLESR